MSLLPLRFLDSALVSRISAMDPAGLAAGFVLCRYLRATCRPFHPLSGFLLAQHHARNTPLPSTRWMMLAAWSLHSYHYFIPALLGDARTVDAYSEYPAVQLYQVTGPILIPAAPAAPA